MKKNVVIIFGGPSHEYFISCKMASEIIDNVDRDLYNVYPIGITQKGKWYYTKASLEEIRDGKSWIDIDNNNKATILANKEKQLVILEKDGMKYINVDVAFIPIPGEYGEDGKIPALLEMADIPFVGSGSIASGCSLDKSVTRLFADEIGLKQPKCLIINKHSFDGNYDYIYKELKKFSYPLFIKPSLTGSSIGITKVIKEDEIKPAIIDAFSFADTVLIEEGITGTEIKVALYGNNKDLVAGSICEIFANQEGKSFNDYNTKYTSVINEKSKKTIPAKLDKGTEDEIIRQAKAIFNAIGCRDYARVDFFLDSNKNIYFNEINTNPGFNSGSIYSLMFIDKGMTYQEIVNGLIKMALDR